MAASDERDVSAARAAVLARFAWVGGHADVWRLFHDPEAFRLVTTALAAPFARDGITRVCGIEARGFVLGGAVARHLDAGFAAVRKRGNLFPGPKLERTSAPDYRGNAHTLQVQRASMAAGDRVVLVDDWAERGSQAATVRELVVATGAAFVGVSLVVDQLDDATRADLGRVHAIVRAEQLGPSA